MRSPSQGSHDSSENAKIYLLWDDMKRAERRKIAMTILAGLIILLAVVHFVVGLVYSKAALLAGSIMIGGMLLAITLGKRSDYGDEYARIRSKLEGKE